MHQSINGARAMSPYLQTTRFSSVQKEVQIGPRKAWADEGTEVEGGEGTIERPGIERPGTADTDSLIHGVLLEEHFPRLSSSNQRRRKREH